MQKNFAKAVSLVDDAKVQEKLRQNPTDSLAALLKLPRKLLLLYVHAYQSYLWNETVTRYLLKCYPHAPTETYSQGKLALLSDTENKELLDLEIPLIGALPLDSSVPVEVSEIVAELLEEEEISRFDFVIKQIPNMTQEGSSRKLAVELSDLQISGKEDDELHTGKKKQTVSFTLGKGSYATMGVRFLFSQEGK